MAGGDNPHSRELDQTPTWAVATVVAVIIIVSLALEKVLHKVGEWLTEKRKRALFEALEKVKTELMILGFISLILTFGQKYIAKICIPLKAADSMLPCAYRGTKKGDDEEHKRRLLWNEHRFLAGGKEPPRCKTGFAPLISSGGIHQLHIFIFFLAVFHVLYSALTMALGRLKTRGWKNWERETTSQDYEFSNDPSRFRLTHETSFVRAHTSFWTRTPILFYIACFFHQFFRSVRKADYLTLRHGFITVHLAPGSKFNFQKYIKRSLEDDFKVVVEISPVLWASLVIFLLLNVNGWQTLFWVSIIPLIIILLVGTKLQAIIAKMALEIQERHAVVQGIPLVQVSDKHFWADRPQLVLSLIQFTLFQNAFQITYFLWIWYEFGMKSCFHNTFGLIVARVALGVAVQVLCSYITLPLYALVSQMGSNMKKSIFDEQTSKALKTWHMKAVKKNREARRGRSPTGTSMTGASPASSPGSSPAHPNALRRFKTTGHSTRLHNSSMIDIEMSDIEADESPMLPKANLIVGMDQDDLQTGSKEHQQGEPPHEEDEFSFVRP